jgi:mortality factor 4-like protein 1
VQEEEYLKRPEIRIPLPDSLKVQLVDDWEFVTKSQRVRRVI